MKVKIDLNKEEKRVLLDIIDKKGNHTRQKRKELCFFSFSQKRKIDECLTIIKEVYMTVKNTLDNDELIYFQDSLAFAFKTTIQDEVQNMERGMGVVRGSEVNTFTKVVDQIIINPKFA